MKAKPKSNDVKKPALILGIAFIALGCTLGISSLAWFVTPSTKTEQVKGMDGRATGSYFKSGNGTASSPYIIANERQLYYFNWLQDLGYFNKDEDGNGTIDQQYYFQLEDNIDASGYTLPPAGTSKYPFVGNFDGNGKTISNLVISNVMNDLTDVPAAAKKEAGTSTLYPNAEIVGFFGIIGQYTNSEPTTSDDKSLVTGKVSCKGSDGNLKSGVTYTIRSVSDSTTTYVNSVNNLYFDNLEVSTNAKTTLTGLLAGYVNGNMQYCGVRSGYFNFGGSVTGALQDSVVGSSNTLLSKYSIIGDYSSAKNFVWSGKPTSGGTGTDWGGSIDLSSLSKRINYIAKSANSGSTPSSYKAYAAFNASLYYNNRGFDWTSTYINGQYVALQETTYLPLNINLQEATISGSYTGEMGSYYTGGSNSTEPILNTNTGYITGKKAGSHATPRLHNKCFNSSTGSGINYSIYQVASGGTLSTDKTDLVIDDSTYQIYKMFEPQNISFFYVDSSTGTSYRIKDDDNKNQSWPSTGLNDIDLSNCGFGNTSTGYYTVKKNFAKMLTDEQTDSNITSSTYGISLNSLQMFSETSNKDITTSTYGSADSKIKINDSASSVSEYDSYEMLDGGVNFTLKQAGSVKMVVGAYAMTKGVKTEKSVVPSFYKVNRSSLDKKKIDSYEKITHVYKSSKNANTYYYSQNDIPDGDEAVEVCNLETLYSQCLVSKCAYYIEIPLNSGDYWFGGDDGNNMSGFVLYLDIGSNAGGEGEEASSETISPIDFVYYSDKTNKVIKQINSVDDKGNSDYTPSKVTFAVSGKPTTVYYYRDYVTTDDGEVLKVLYVNSAGNNASVEATGTGARDAGTILGYGIKKEDETSGS